MNVHVENVIVAGVDGSESSNAAALWAAAQAQCRKAELRLVGSYWVTVGFAGPAVVMQPDLIDDVREAALSVLANSRDLVAATYPDLEVTTQLRHEQPISALCKASQHALMTVVVPAAITRSPRPSSAR